MSNINVVEWKFKDTASPDDFAEIKTLTPWRAMAVYMREMTNINNTHSLEFDDTSDDYQYISYFFQKGKLLDSLRGQMWSINMDFEFTSDGMFKLVRNMRYIPTADRSALTTIADFQFKHYTNTTIDDIMYSLEKDHSYQVGKAIAGNGWYNTTSKKVTFFASISPPVQPARGPEQSATDRQILKADLIRADAETEGKQRVRNDFAAKQFLDTLRMRVAGGMLGKMNPSVSQLYTHTLTVSDGLRRITYTTSDKWLLTSFVLALDNITGQLIFDDATFQIESDDLGFAISIRNPLPLTFYDNPVMMPLPAMPAFDYNPSIDLPTGAVEGDEQPITQTDTNPVDGAQDPSTMVALNNSTVVVWSETRAEMTREFGQPAPTWFDITPDALPSGHKIQQFAWNRSEDGGTGGYLIAHNDTIADPDTRVYYRKNVGSMEVWSEAILTNMLATMVNVTGKEAVIVYGKFEQFISGAWTLNQLDGDGTEFIDSYTGATDSASDAAGTYDAANDRYKGAAGDGGGVANNAFFNIAPGATVTNATVTVHAGRTGATSGDRNCRIWHIAPDGTNTSLASANFGSGSYTAGSPAGTLGMNTGTVSVGEGIIVFHGSMDKPSVAVRLVDIHIEGSGLADFAGTRFSDDRGKTFEAARNVGSMTLGDGSFTRRKGQRVLAAKDENVKRAPLAGEAFLFNADQGAAGVGAGQFATALKKFGKDDDYLMALDATTGLQKVVNNVLTDITPNDGGNDGFAVSNGALAMTSVDDDFVYFLSSYGGVFKLAYSTDLGSSWNFNADPTSNANWVDVNPRSTTTVYIADGATVLRSLDGGPTLTSHTSPISSLKGVAAL
ncbi:hypothetical protein LCGC14_1190930 [marine sediment metagenome]|uniref:Uncharacterized protein n=1 Tax=marine sediment metagenome TaxID=412755 RepID=A0A0F9PPQ0_9ZZZZ